MALLIFAIVVILVAVLCMWLVDLIPNANPPLPAILKIAILLLAILAIANRAGFL